MTVNTFISTSNNKVKKIYFVFSLSNLGGCAGSGQHSGTSATPVIYLTVGVFFSFFFNFISLLRSQDKASKNLRLFQNRRNLCKYCVQLRCHGNGFIFFFKIFSRNIWKTWRFFKYLDTFTVLGCHDNGIFPPRVSKYLSSTPPPPPPPRIAILQRIN